MAEDGRTVSEKTDPMSDAITSTTSVVSMAARSSTRVVPSPVRRNSKSPMEGSSQVACVMSSPEVRSCTQTVVPQGDWCSATRPPSADTDARQDDGMGVMASGSRVSDSAASNELLATTARVFVSIVSEDLLDRIRRHEVSERSGRVTDAAACAGQPR